MLKYKGIVFDDYTYNDEDWVKEGGPIAWAYMCRECANRLSEDDKRSLDDAVPDGATCGVKGCENEAEYYFDLYEKDWDGRKVVEECLA